jgi:hypothetical protein
MYINAIDLPIFFYPFKKKVEDKKIKEFIKGIFTCRKGREKILNTKKHTFRVL